MADEHYTTQEEDEVILCVRFTSLLAWLFGIAAIAFTPLFHHVPYALMLRAQYFQALVLVLSMLCGLAVGVDLLFTKHILFYQDRLVKVWYVLGQRTIPYARAKLLVNPRYVHWLIRPKSYRVKECNDRGQPPLMQIPISYCNLCVSRETAKKVEAVTSYLVGLEDCSRLYERSRLFEKTTLPKEVLCRQNSQRNYT